MDNSSFVVYLVFGELSWAIFYLKNLVKIDKYLRDIVVSVLFSFLTLEFTVQYGNH